MGENTKITKRDYLLAIRTMVEETNEVCGIPSADVVAFLDTQVAQLDAKAAKAKEKAEEKKAEGDALRETVLGVVTSEWMTGDQITELIGKEDVTKAKVTARLSQLVSAGSVTKDLQKIGDRKLTVYKLA